MSKKNIPSFDMTTLLPDDWGIAFTSLDKFQDAVFALDRAKHWEAVSVKDLAVMAAAPNAKNLVGGSAAYNENTYFACLFGGRKKPVAISWWAADSLQLLAQDNAGIFRKMLTATPSRADIVAGRLTEDLQFLPEDKNILVLVSGGKVRGMFGDFNNSWTETEQLRAIIAKLEETFGNYNFLRGSISHVETKAEFQLGPSITDTKFLKTAYGTANSAVLTPYLKTWTDAGLPSEMFEEAIPTLEFRTGESGLAQLMLVPKIRYKAWDTPVSVLLGAPLKIKHRGSDATVWGTFVNYLDEVAAVYQQGIKGIVDLTTVMVKNPYSCLTHLLKPLRPSTPQKEMRETMEAFELAHPIGCAPCSAFELYETINDMNQRVAEVVSVTKQLQNMEFTAKMLLPNFNWKKFDLKKPAVFSRGGTLKDEEMID